MNITTFSDYSLRVLIYLASSNEDKVTAARIAKSYDISFHHVAKAAQWLTRNGYLLSSRGREGGLSLRRAPETINIGEILRATERDAGTPLVDCMREGGGDCRIRSSCGLKFALSEAENAFYDVLSKFSLKDITRQNSAIAKLLQVDV